MKAEKKGGKREVVAAFYIILFLIVLVHTYYNIYGLSIPKISQAGISGNAIFGDLLKKTEDIAQKNRMIIAAEWLILIILSIYFLIKTNKTFEKERKIENIIAKININPQIKKSRSKTDLDVLYDLLKKNKLLTIKAISKYFKVSSEVAMNWCKILEEGDLAEIDYPAIGEPRIILIEKVIKNNK